MLGGLFAEASRRRVFRGSATYVVVAWLALQAVGLTTAADDPLRRLALTWAVGLFPLAILFSWVFQLQGGAVHREHKGGEAPPRTAAGRTLDFVALGGLGVIALIEAAKLITLR